LGRAERVSIAEGAYRRWNGLGRASQ
jgi:hypothetical protein